MGKYLQIIFSMFLLLGIIGCSDQSEKAVPKETKELTKKIEQKDVREVVWGQLTSEQKKWINGTWEDGKVSTVTLNINMMSRVKDKSYAGKEVYVIDFPFKGKGVPNNMSVYADVMTHKYIGVGLVD